MPCYMYINGMKQEMDEDLFDQMAEALHQSSTPQNPPTTTSTRWKHQQGGCGKLYEETTQQTD